MSPALLARVPDEKLQVIADELGCIYAERLEDMKAAQFARTLSVLARCELSRRAHVEDKHG